MVRKKVKFKTNIVKIKPNFFGKLLIEVEKLICNIGYRQ